MINAFIARFSSARELFMNGACYYFAVILKERFGGRIVYDDIDGHFLSLIDGKLYDVTGERSDVSNVVEWDAYEGGVDASGARMAVIKGCILMEE